MVRIIVLVSFIFSLLNSAEVKDLKWEKGETLITFLSKNHIPKDVYFNLSKTDKELCSEIVAGVEYQSLLGDSKELLHTLIPISEEMQIHIKKDINDSYTLDIIPIEFDVKEELLTFPIESSPYKDILAHTNNKKLANEFIRIFRKSINFRKLHKNDMISIKYEQKVRMGKYFGTPRVLGVYVKMKYQRDKFVFENEQDGRYYDDKAKSLTSVFFKVPLRYKRISSKFTYKRYHPILKRYRAHLGVDFAAPTGRRVWSTADGKIIHRGRKGGYGNTVIVQHSNGYRSLYAHLSKYRGGQRVGTRVKQGDTIGYVGSTGRSTGPHLHFGMYKNGRAVNPQKVISYAKTTLSGEKRRLYYKSIKSTKDQLTKLEIKKDGLKLDQFTSISQLTQKI